MSLTCWGFVYTADGSSPDGDVSVVDTGRCRTIFVGLAAPDQVVPVARRLVEEEQVQLIELCGGFGPRWAGKVVEAVGDVVPVGVVGYGPESVDGLHAIFS